MNSYVRCIESRSFLLALSASLAVLAACSELPSPAGLQSEYSIAGTALTSPVKVVSAEYYHDGGSIALSLSDAVGRELWLVSDRAMVPVSSDAELERMSKDCCRFYVGGFPGMPGASPMERGGRDELEVQRLLNDCINTDRAGGLHFAPTVASFLERLEDEIQLHSAGNSASNRRAN